MLASLFHNITALASWNVSIWGNTVGQYVTAFGVFLGLVIVIKLFQVVALNRLTHFAEKTKNDVDDLLIGMVQTVSPLFYFYLAFYFAVKWFLGVAKPLHEALNVILVVYVTVKIAQLSDVGIDYAIKRATRGGGAAMAKAASEVVKVIAKVLIWVLALLLILQNFGVDVTSLIAGLGIGGLAVALALQNILTDLFSSFAIYFDKPFVPGDFIIVGSDMGTVKKIGVKTTRIASLSGEELVISNRELTSARIQNFKRMAERRVVFTFGVVYETPTEKMKEIPGIIKEIVAGVEQTRLDRTNFKSFDDFALTFENVYYVLSPDYNLYMNIQEEINLKIKEAFEKKGIVMAYPTQTLYVQKS